MCVCVCVCVCVCARARACVCVRCVCVIDNVTVLILCATTQGQQGLATHPMFPPTFDQGLAGFGYQLQPQHAHNPYLHYYSQPSDHYADQQQQLQPYMQQQHQLGVLQFAGRGGPPGLQSPQSPIGHLPLGRGSLLSPFTSPSENPSPGNSDFD